jgi:hypothetical protein
MKAWSAECKPHATRGIGVEAVAYRAFSSTVYGPLCAACDGEASDESQQLLVGARRALFNLPNPQLSIAG